MQTVANSSQKIAKEICQNFPKVANKFQILPKMPQVANSCHMLPKVVTCCPLLSLIVKIDKSSQMLPHVAKSCQTLQQIVRSCHMLAQVATWRQKLPGRTMKNQTNHYQPPDNPLRLGQNVSTF